jgi:hypothetical protein
MATDFDLDDLIDQAAVAALPRGRRASMAPPTVVCEISEEHFPLMLRPHSVNGADKPLARLRATHHLAARCLAEGKKNFEVAEITGYTPGRINDLLKDPTFKDLVEHYKSEVKERWTGVQERLAGLGIAMTEEIQQRLEEAPEKISNEELRRWVETLMDRAGFGPTKTANLNVKSQNATLHLIEMIKSEAEKSSNVKLLAAE